MAHLGPVPCVNIGDNEPASAQQQGLGLRVYGSAWGSETLRK